MEHRVENLEDLQAQAAALVARLTPKTNGATLVVLSGDLGAGKTTFVQAVARALGVTEDVTSPTFVLQKIYPLTGSPFKRLIHMDAYRLEESGALIPLGFDETLEDPHTLIMLEWPENVADALPAPDVSIALEALPDGTRALTYA